jgi:hypothetical protein
MKYVCKRINWRVGMEMSFRFENQLAESCALWRRSSRCEESKVNLLWNEREKLWKSWSSNPPENLRKKTRVKDVKGASIAWFS